MNKTNVIKGACIWHKNGVVKVLEEKESKKIQDSLIKDGWRNSVNLTNPVIITYPTYKKYTTGLVKTSDIS